ncbi:GNAT family N-acetyltransferase [Algicella marina]|uniref:GNAT family N-acetyltransferase n=1 Tax=Algicella marina TaxID=2683284 RepID=A0A6P1T1P8_9RHOB|nr:GNAT family protein [Algicella marina]QHQ35661.1 GNAT family N-acetyltransferase [Algicella marina]
MFRRRPHFALTTQSLVLRQPQMGDFGQWSNLLQQSEEFLKPWEPHRAPDHYTRRGFRNRVAWAERAMQNGRALPMFLFADEDILVGGLTLDNIRKGPSQAGTVGYWIGEPYARRGYMREALNAVVEYAFRDMDLSRIEAACLPENAASRSLLETSGFKYEGVAQSYLQIAGRWRTHVLYANLRMDRRGRVESS